MDDFLTKPLRENELRVILRQHLKVSTIAAMPLAATTTAPETTTAPAPAIATAIDPQAREMLMGMPGSAPGITLFDELTKHFRGEFTSRFNALAADVMSGDAIGTAQKAHAIKGSAQTLGMQPLSVVLGHVERCARANDLGGALQHLGEIEHEWNRVLQALDSDERIGV